MAVNFNLPTVDTTYTEFPTQIIENIDAALQQLSIGSPANIPANAIKWDSNANRWKKYVDSNNDGNFAFEDLTSTYNFNANISATRFDMGDSASSSGGTNAIMLGASDDLRIFHDGNNSFIRDFNGAGNLKITTNQLEVLSNGAGEAMAKFIQNGSVELYENNVKRFNTSNSGATITGALTTTGTMFAQGGSLSLTNAGGTNQIEVGAGQTGDHFAFIDLIGDATHTDFGLRLIRGETNNQGENTNSSLVHNGTGLLKIVAAGSGKVSLNTNGLSRMFVNESGNIGIGTTSPSKIFDILSIGTPDIIIRSSAASSHDAKLRLRGSRTGAPTDINQIIFETNDTGGGNYAAGSRLGSIICGKQTNNTTKGFFSFRLNNTQILDGSLGTDNVSKMHIKATNEVGIGTTNPQRLLELSSANQTSIIRLHSTDTTIQTGNRIGMIEFSGNDADNSGISAFIEAVATNNIGQAGLRFATGGAGSAAEKMRLDGGGRLIFGRTTQFNSRVGTGSVQPMIQVHHEEDGSMSLTRYVNASGHGGRLFIQKARGTIATPLVVEDGDNTGEIRFSGYDGTNFANGCTILNRVNGTVSSNTLPSDLEFYIRDSTGTSRELLTLNHDRFVGINKATPVTALHVRQLTDNAGGLRVEDAGDANTHCTIDVTDTLTSFTTRRNNNHGNIRFQSNNGTTTTENMRLIQNTGVAIGTTANASADKLTVSGGRISTNSFIIASRGEGGVALTHNDGGGNANVTFNHVSLTPEQNGKSARIDVNTDSSGGVAIMKFGLKHDSVDGQSGGTHNSLQIKRGSEADLGVGSGTALRAQIIFNQGTTTFPTLAFESDADTGISRSAANTMSLITNATERVKINNSGLEVTSGQAKAVNTAKAWLNVQGGQSVAANNPLTINNSFNVSSVTDTGEGKYTIAFTEALGNANFCPVFGFGRQDSNMIIYVDLDSDTDNMTTAVCKLRTTNSWSSGGTLDDVGKLFVAFFGD